MNQDRGPLVGSFIVVALLSFFLGTCIVWGRPVVQKNVTDTITKCDKSQFQMDTEAANKLCYSTNVASFEYTDNGKGEKNSPVVKCKESR